MPRNVFEENLVRIQTRFNQTIGTMPLCCPKVRIRAIFAIVQMGLLQQRIKNQQNLADIKQFNLTNNKLNMLFAKLSKERKNQTNSKQNQIIKRSNRSA